MFLRRRNLYVLLMCITVISCSFCSTHMRAAGKSKSGYTKKLLKVDGKDKNGERIDIAQQLQLSYNQKYKLCTPYYHQVRGGAGFYYVRSWSAKGKMSDRRQKCKYDSYLTNEHTKINDKGIIFSMGMASRDYYDERKRRDGIIFNAVSAKGKLLSHFCIDKAGHFFDPEPLDEEGNRRENYQLEDFEINGDYVDYIIARVNGSDFIKSGKYSLQRFNWKTGELVSCYELPRPCQKLCGGCPYGTDMKSFYKYSKDGNECLWESVLPGGKTSLGLREQDTIKQEYCVIEGKLFYSNVNGVFMLSTLENNSKPERLITVKDCPELSDKLALVVEILAVNEKHFYISISHENGLPDILYQYKKK